MVYLHLKNKSVSVSQSSTLYGIMSNLQCAVNDNTGSILMPHLQCFPRYTMSEMGHLFFAINMLKL